MSHYDVFNGDADGICALHQYRLQNPASGNKLITGVKRDIRLLSRIQDTPESITVFDISFASNREQTEAFLACGTQILYIDHHFAGPLPESGNLTYHIDPSPTTCTSLIVNRLQGNAFPLWAVCGAFGDNLHEQAAQLAQANNVCNDQLLILQEIGELLNYNGYGKTVADLIFDPEQLYHAIAPFENPFHFYEETSYIERLRTSYQGDLEKAFAAENISTAPHCRVYHFPDEPWARRISGVFSNIKAREKGGAAHAIITTNPDTTLQISVRAPLTNRRDADTLCRRFPTGGGRAAAAGINNLPQEMLDTFLSVFSSTYKEQ